MRVDNSPPAPFILGLGIESVGGHAVAAGVWTGGHPEAVGRVPLDDHSGSMSPIASLVGGGAEPWWGRWPLIYLKPPPSLSAPLLSVPDLI